MTENDEPYLMVEKHLVERGLFPTSTGYLKAKIYEINDGEKSIVDGTTIMMSSFDLIVAREYSKNIKFRIKKGKEKC